MANSQTYTLNIKALFDASDVTKGAQQIQNVFKNIKVSNTLQSDFQKAFSNLENSVAKVQQKYEQGFKTKGDVSSFEKSFKEMENAATQYEKVIQRIQSEVGTSVDLSKLIKWDDSTLSELKRVEDEIKRVKSSLQFNTPNGVFKDVEKALSGITSKAPKTTEAINNFKNALLNGDLAEAETQLNKLQSIWSHFKDNSNRDAIFGTATQEGLVQAFEKLKSSGVFAELEKLYNQKGQVQTAGWEKLVALFNKADIDISKLNGEFGKVKGNISGAASAQQAWNSSVDQFKSRIQYFFGLNNVIQLIRRSLREALNTVKELDAAMAQTAVVTNFTIADMWDQLPRYTEVANQLGVTTKGAYETMTLFYQQGLDTNQTFAIGTETMKMARIAGIDYATATDYMTAALRGFNMELNELSAQRVNDVYSRLAAITASNTQEISTAMTKVASLAHNANMEFETTSAFLAQIIETTRESAETAGTALKTVVARFSEVKKMINTNQLRGTDEEGDIIDVNRVSAALRTAGIDMNKYFLGEVGLDDIFMELASKWDSLTSVQQRYIATQAAGSRQQSRFIAMMSNYARTQQLVQEAYNSNGASAKQFEKTQASLETALNRLNNAWDQFTMNLANNDAIKTAVNALTELLNAINKVTGAFGSGWRTLLTGGLTIGALLGGGRLTNAAFSASKIARANANLSWGQAFKTQLGRNPYTYDLSSGAVNGQTTRFHLFGQDGFFDPAGQYLVQHDNILKNSQQDAEYRAAQRLGRQRRAGGITAGVGLALSAGGSAIQQNAESIAKSFDTSTESVQKFGKSMSTLGTTASVAGSMLMLIPGPLGIIAAAITGLIGLFVAFRGETQGELLTRLSEETESAAAAAKSAKQAYDDLLSGAAAHDELLDKISNLKEGTLEFREAILEANQAALDLIENYDLPSDSYTRDRNGLIMFNPGAIEQAQERQLDLVEKTAQNASVAKLVENAQLNLAKSDYNLEEELKTIGEDTLTRIKNDLSSGNLDELWGGSRGNVYTMRAIQQAAQAAGYGTNYAEYIKGVQSGVTTGSIRGQEDYRSTLYTLAGNNLTDATKLAIEELASSYDAANIAQIRQESESKYKNYTDEQLKAAYREEIGPLAKDLQIDDIKDALVHNAEATELNAKLAEARNNIDVKAAAQAKRFSKTALSQVLGNAIGSTDTYTLLAAQSAQRTLATTQRQVAENTDLGVNLRFGDFTPEQIEQIGNIAESFGQTFGNKASTYAVSTINNELVKDGNSSLLNKLNQITFSGVASTDLKKIRDLGENYSDIFAAAFEDIGGNKGLFESFYFGQTEVIDGFNKIVDAEGKISGDDILDAADSCQELADLLEVGEINAAGLAAALTEIELDNLDPTALTEGLLKALSAAESVNQVIAEADDFLNNWHEQPSGARFAEWASGGAKSILDAWGAGRYQDQQARQYLSTMLGTDFLRDYNKIMQQAGKIAEKSGSEQALAYLEKNLNQELDLFNQLAEAENLKPLYDYFEQNGKYTEKLSQFGVTFKDGMVHFDDSVKTADEAVKRLTDAGINETLANLMVSDFIQNSPDAIVEWGKNAAQAGVDAFQQQIQDGKLVLRSELEQFNSLYGDLLPEGWLDQFISEHQGQVIDLAVDWINSTDPIKALEDAFDGSKGLQSFLEGKGAFGTQTIGGVKGILDPKQLNLDNLLTAFQQLGANEAQALTLAQQYADAISETGGKQATFNAEYTKWTQDSEGNWIATTEQVYGYANAVDAAAAAQAEAQKSLQEMESQIRRADISAGVKDAFGTLASEGTEIKVIYKPEDYQTKLPEKEEIPVNYNVADYQSKLPSSEIIEVYYHYNNEKEDGGAKGGYVPSYASGSATNRLNPGVALTGEEGPEIVWNKNQGYAYITGEKHPEFQNLQPGDRVFNAQETKKILQGAAAGGKVPAYAIGYLPGIDTNSKKSSGGGGGGGSGKEEKENEWKNELDWLYNLMEDIAELERDQKAIEEQYEDYLKDQSKTGKDLYNLLIKQLGNLYTQLDHQTFALQKREQEMREFMDVTNDKDQYLWYNWKDRTLEIDWDAIDRITDEEEYKHVKELVDEAEAIQDKMDDAEDAIMDINNQIQELEDIWRDTYIDFEQRVYDAIVQSYQKVIDNYSELNDTLNNSNQQILDSLQKQISLQRQIRDNTKTEEQISDDEAKLAYLRRDTTGGNDLAALQLQKELDEQMQDYEDTLVDQAVNRLQEDNDAAAQQRQQQIDIMQAQLDYQSQNGEFNAYVKELLTSAMGAEGELLTNSDLVSLLKDKENWAAMSDVSKEVWDKELNETFKEVVAFLLKQNSEQNGTFYTALTKAVEGVSSAIGSYSQAMTKLGNQISSAGSSGGGGGGGSSGSNNSGSNPAPQKPAQSNTTRTNLYHTIYQVVNGTPKYRYATGGLANMPGIAWLDGTPSEPEYVLNARQTDAFLKLADVLPSMMGSSAGAQTNTFGSTYINVAVNLDSVSPDYDVERMIDLVKEKLYDSGTYRNINSLNFLR